MNVYIDNQSSRTCSVENSSSAEEDNALNDDGVDNSATNEPDEFDENLIQHAICNARAVEELDGTDQCMAADMASPKGTDGCRETKMAKLRSIHSGRTNETLRSGFAKRDLKLAKVCRMEAVCTSTRSSSGRACEENQAGRENIASTNAENKSSGENLEQIVSNQNDSKRCRAEVALVDSQTSEESNFHQKRKRVGKLRPSTLRDSPARVEPTGKLFPNS